MSSLLGRLIKILAVIAVIFAAVGLWLNYRNTVPTAPIYDNSILVNEFSLTSEGIFYPLISYDYVSPDTLENIVRFYSEDGTCEPASMIVGRVLCKGKAKPFGEYTVYIDSPKSSSLDEITYSIEIIWERPFLIRLSV